MLQVSAPMYMTKIINFTVPRFGHPAVWLNVTLETFRTSVTEVTVSENPTTRRETMYTRIYESNYEQMAVVSDSAGEEWTRPAGIIFLCVTVLVHNYIHKV